MSELELKKVTQQTAAEIGQRYEMEQTVSGLLAEKLSPANFVSLLSEKHHYAEATHFMVFALPKREAIWLACMACQACHPDQMPRALELAEKWVYDPKEENRKPAAQAAEADGYNTPEGIVAGAVAWSGGSLTPEDAEPVAPAEDLSAKAVWGALLLLAYSDEPAKATDKFKNFLHQAIDIANGGAGRTDS